MQTCSVYGKLKENNLEEKEPQEEVLLPSRYREGKSPSGEITTGPSGRTLPSCNLQNKYENVNSFLPLSVSFFHASMVLETDC